jgi:hypothetical protein
MKKRKVAIEEGAVDDLRQGKRFYDRKEHGLGDYFINSLLADLESLAFYAGIHRRYAGFYRMLSKRFPFAIYYDIREDTILVVAVLDMKSNPAWTRSQLSKRKK